MKNSKIIDIFTDGATVGRNGKLGTVREVCLGLHIPSINFGDGRKVDGISNNEAEFKALIWGMETAKEKGFKNVRFNLDSKIVVNRANGKRPQKKYWNERMNAFQDKIFELMKNFDNINFNWIPREMNSIADYYSNIAKKIIIVKFKDIPEIKKNKIEENVLFLFVCNPECVNPILATEKYMMKLNTKEFKTAYQMRHWIWWHIYCKVDKLHKQQNDKI